MNPSAQLLEYRRIWTPPKGLGHSAPRPVRLTREGIAVLVLGGLLLAGAAAAAIGLGGMATRQAAERRLLREQGVEVRGVITRLRRTRGDDPELRVYYRFGSPDGTHAGQARAPRRLWDELREGSELPIRYLPSNPAVSIPAGWDRSVLPMWVAVLCAASLAAFGVLLIWRVRREIHLLSEGRAAPAVVTRLKKVRSEHQHGTVVYYEFLLLSGAAAEGKYGPLRRPPAVGSTLSVVYDPDNPRRSACYPMRLVRPDD